MARPNYTTRQIGLSLENLVAELFKPLFYSARPTKGSGNRGQAGDIQQPWFIVECKNRNTKNITIKADVWKKLCNEVPLHSSRLPLYILQNNERMKWAVLDLKDFMTIFEGYLENEKSKWNREKD